LAGLNINITVALPLLSCP